MSVERDPEAVSVKFHNRTGIELVISPSVRKGQMALPLGGVYRLPPNDTASPDKERPDLELTVFKFLPALKQDIGAYTIEVSLPDSPARLAVIDLTNQEMTQAKAEGRLTFVFLSEGVRVVVGKESKVLPWLRTPTVSNP